jgi:hypothetical protein
LAPRPFAEHGQEDGRFSSIAESEKNMGNSCCVCSANC